MLRDHFVDEQGDMNKYQETVLQVCERSVSDSGQSVTGAGCLRIHPFPLPICIPPISPQSPSYIIWGWYNRPVVAAVPRDSVSPH
jgi:hypothetical protein